MEPEWFKHSKYIRCSDSVFKITYVEDEETHDGYCSDRENEDIISETKVVYLRDGDWDFEQKHWSSLIEWHCSACCRAMRYIKVISIDRI